MAYIGKSPSGLGVRARYFYTATGGETSLSGADDNGRTLKFTDGEYVDVYLNGVLLVAGTDYGTGTANTISGLDALSAGNIVEIVAYDIFSLNKPNTEALRKRYYKTATGGETSISGSDDAGQTITFAANAEIEVYLNGVALVQGDDYNTSTANTVGGLAALDAGDIVAIVSYEEFVLGDVVSKKSGGTFGDSISVSGDLTVDTDTLYVDSTNNRVGIGTSSPTVSGNAFTTLNVKGNASNTGLITVTSNDLDSSVQLYSGNSSSDNPAIAFQNDLRFGSATDAGVGGFSERMRIDSSGNVGIGTTSPVAVSNYTTQTLDGGTASTGGSMTEYQQNSASSTGLRIGCDTSSSGFISQKGAKDLRIFTNSSERMRIDASGRVTKPSQPHIHGSPTNTGGSGNATSFATSYSRNILSFVTDRITVPVAGLYLVNFNTISDNTTGRVDGKIFINGVEAANALSEDNGQGFHYKGLSAVFGLSANDYIQFYNADWYDATNTTYQAWRTASVTLIA